VGAVAEAALAEIGPELAEAPVELALRLIRMFSFAGDTILDPFSGTATTTIAAVRSGRNSIGSDVDPCYFAHGVRRVLEEADAERSTGASLVEVAHDPVVQGPSSGP
jgi:modification methylase